MPVDTTPLRVGFDASAAAVVQPTGVGLAMAHLVRALQAIAPGQGVELEVLYRFSRARRWSLFLPGTRRLYHERLSVLLARRLDVFHGPDSRLPSFQGPALVSTVHDLSARRPGFATARFRRTRERHWEQVVRRESRVVTYTQAIRDEVVRELGVPAGRISVVPLAPTDGTAPLPEAEADSVVARHVGARPYVICVGELSRRKNTAGALAVFANTLALADHALVLAGPAGRGADAVVAEIARLGLGERVVWPSYLPVDHLAGLLQRARALLFPSRYEGFGMPLLEAFRAGVPVVASRDPSLLEVSGGAALHRDADDTEGLAEDLSRAALDVPLREDLVARGRARAAEFSWERSAAALLDVYRAAHGRAAAPAPAEETPCRS